MMITIGSDHKGFDLKTKIIEQFSNFYHSELNSESSHFIQWLDVGTNSSERIDYPIFAKKACQNILDGKAQLGILICGSGVGMSIAANRFKKIYAALCWNEEVAKLARQDDGANVLVLPADLILLQDAYNIITAWLKAKFKGDEYRKRLEMIDE